MDWNIQSRAPACSECGTRFADRETLHTLLLRDAEGFSRVDVCVKCWESQFAEGVNHRRGFVSHWRTVHLVPRKEPEPIQRASAETLLRQLLERNLPEYTGACFVLAVMLERKRILKPQGRSTENGRRVLHYEHAKSGDVFHVVDPDLRLDQLATVQRQVARLLEHGLPDDSAAPAESAPENPPASDGDAEPAPAEEAAPNSEEPPAGEHDAASATPESPAAAPAKAPSEEPQTPAVEAGEAEPISASAPAAPESSAA